MDKIVHQVSAKKIKMSDIKPGMVVAKDIVTGEGFVLTAKDTMITSGNYNRLIESSIKEIYIKEATINVRPEEILEKPQAKRRGKIPISETKDFQEFAQEYEGKLEVAKNRIKAISDGETVNVEELYEITNSIVKKLKTKSDVLTYVSFLKEHDEYTYSHSSNVALLSNMFATWLNFDETDMANLTTAGLLHDLGKLKIPLDILNKKGRLTEHEFNVMKSHTIIGYRILQNQNLPESMKLAALMHHERIDGSGYPIGAKDAQISKYAKIIAICDIYDAMTANRVYRGRICPFEVIKRFEVSSFGELDTDYLLTFLKNIAYTYFGSWVKLSNGMEAEIVYIHQNDLSRPIVRANDMLIDIQKTKGITIVDVL